MKRIVLTAVAVLMLLNLGMAQDCSKFIGAVNGKKMVYANMDAKGRNAGKFNYTMTKKDAATVAIHTEVLDKDGKSIGTSDSEAKCNGNVISIDMKSFIPASSMKQFNNMKMEGDAKYLVYPLNMKAGQTLEDGTVTINIINNGSPMGNFQMDLTNRKVEQAESISTAAGSFDCFRITYDAMIKVKMMGIGFPVHMHVTEWFAPKLARPVKSETYTKNGKLAGSMVLESIN
jgi:hypothetical protein